MSKTAFKTIRIAPAFGSTSNLLPDNWQHIPFNVNQKEVACTYMPADNPKAILALKHGYNSNSLEYDLRKGHPDAPNVFQYLNDRNISVITLSSAPIDPSNLSFVKDYEDEVQEFLFSSNSPVFQIADGLPVHALAHSLGGLAMLKKLTEKENLNFANHKLTSVNFMNPALAIADVTRFSLVRSFYKAWSNTFPNNIPGTTLVGKSYMAFRGIPIENDNPTHRHIQIMETEGAACRKNIRNMINNGSFKHDFDLGFIIGAEDPTTCPIINLRTANMLGANIITSPSRHTPILPPKRVSYSAAEHVPTPRALIELADHISEKSKDREHVIQMNTELSGKTDYIPPAASIA